jgi:diguanylate cyclase (GGDEF)-like protein
VSIDATERLEMLGATLDLLDEGVAVLDSQSRIVFWNTAASELTGYQRMHVLSRPCPTDLYKVAEDHLCIDNPCVCAVEPPFSERAAAEKSAAVREYTGPKYSGQMYVQKGISFEPSEAPEQPGATRGVRVEMKHQLGHTLPAMLRNLPLRDDLGKRMGTVLLFRPVEDLDAIPHGETMEGLGLGGSQAEIEDRLENAFHEWKTNHVPFGLLWITIDQAAQMRRTHGKDACEAMLRIVEHRLAQGLRPSEIIGRWGSDEFLVLSHERTAQMLLTHGEHLAGMTRTAEFRWWGDRVSLTASIGTAQAGVSHSSGTETLPRLMLEAQQAMHASIYAGGNHVSQGSSAAQGSGPAPVSKGETCSR